jgi:PAS domain S-box-containing protein
VFARKHSDEHFRILFDTAPNGVIAVDAAGRIALLNAQAEKMFGYRRAELIGKPVEVLVPQRFRGGHVDLRKRAAANPRTRPMGTNRVFFGLRKDGSEFPVEIGLNPVVMSAKQFVIATVVDITERKAELRSAWHLTTVALLFLVFGLVIAIGLKPLWLAIPQRILAFGTEQPTKRVDAAYAAYQKGNYAVALRLVRPMAEQGDSRAESLLGLIYFEGHGVQRDEAEARKWYRRAADQGDTDAQLEIGDMYHEGRGVAQDYSEAVRWYRLAADHGNAAAQYNLGISYARGTGVPQDNIVAYMWFNLAATRFKSPVSRVRAVGNRNAVAKKMSPEEIARAQALAHEWQADETTAVHNADGAVVSRAEWKVERGTKVGSLRNHQVGIIATLPATATFDGVSAYLQVECLEHPEVTTRIVNLVTSKDTAPGLMMWRYQLDDNPPTQHGPYSRLSLKVIGLGDSSSDEFEGLLTGRRLRVTLMPTTGPQWSFEFDLRGAPQAINAVSCQK